MSARRQSHLWTEEEDQQLIRWANYYNCSKWWRIAEKMGEGYDSRMCYNRWRCMKDSTKPRKYVRRTNTMIDERYNKGAWKADEDARLVDAMSVDHRSWKDIALLVQTRNHKQCRQRWELHLRPEVNHNRFTITEDEEIIKLQKELGNQWAEIGRRMQRTDNSIKNRWYTALRRRKSYDMEKIVPLEWDSTKIDNPEDEFGLPALPVDHDQILLELFGSNTEN